MRLRNCKFITYADKSPCHQLPSHQQDQDYKSKPRFYNAVQHNGLSVISIQFNSFFSAKHSMFYKTPINGFTILGSIQWCFHAHSC